jgi:hypothetical protein
MKKGKKMLIYRSVCHSASIFSHLCSARISLTYFGTVLILSSSHLCLSKGLGSVVGIASYGLDGPGVESRWGAGFSAPIQTGPGAHPSSCTVGVFRGKERPGRDTDPSLPSSAMVMEGRAMPVLPVWAVRPVQSLSACTLKRT